MHMNSAVTWFEIPASDLGRAAAFYAEVIGRKLARQTMGPTEMAVFPYEPASGVGGCVLESETVKPGQGSIVYLHVGKDIDGALNRAERAGGRYVALAYRDGNGRETRRRVRSLGLFFWDDVWTLGAWCELRQDFRNFRLDRIVENTIEEARFPDEPGRRLADFLRAMSANGAVRTDGA